MTKSKPRHLKSLPGIYVRGPDLGGKRDSMFDKEGTDYLLGE